MHPIALAFLDAARALVYVQRRIAPDGHLRVQRCLHPTSGRWSNGHHLQRVRKMGGSNQRFPTLSAAPPVLPARFEKSAHAALEAAAIQANALDTWARFEALWCNEPVLRALAATDATGNELRIRLTVGRFSATDVAERAPTGHTPSLVGLDLGPLFHNPFLPRDVLPPTPEEAAALLDAALAAALAGTSCDRQGQPDASRPAGPWRLIDPGQKYPAASRPVFGPPAAWSVLGPWLTGQARADVWERHSVLDSDSPIPGAPEGSAEAMARIDATRRALQQRAGHSAQAHDGFATAAYKPPAKPPLLLDVVPEAIHHLADVHSVISAKAPEDGVTTHSTTAVRAEDLPAAMGLLKALLDACPALVGNGTCPPARVAFHANNTNGLDVTLSAFGLHTFSARMLEAFVGVEPGPSTWAVIAPRAGDGVQVLFAAARPQDAVWIAERLRAADTTELWVPRGQHPDTACAPSAPTSISTAP